MTSSAQLEQEAERTRSQLAATLAELRERVTPGQLVDEAVDFAKDSTAGHFVRNLGRHSADNPLPVALIGTGLAWLMLSSGRQSRRSTAQESIDSARRAGQELGGRSGDTARPFGERVGERSTDAGATVGDAADRAGEVGRNADAWGSQTRAKLDGAADQESRSWKDRADRTADVVSSTVSDTGADLTERASALYGSAQAKTASAAAKANEAASTAYDRLSAAASRTGSALTQSTADLGQKARVTGRSLLQTCTEQPLVLAGLGLTLGALLGALLPPTQTEDRVMGQTSDQLKGQAGDFAQDQYGKAKAAVEEGLNKTQEKAQEQGLAGVPAEPVDTSLVPAEEQNETGQNETGARH